MSRGSRTILDIESLDLIRGELLGIIGPNGAGKTTLATVLGLIERANEGDISFDGVVVSQRGATLALRRRVAMVFQESLLLNTSVAENVETGLRLRGVSRTERAARVSTWLKQLKIEHLAERSARSLSGGEAQRVSLARALVLEPSLLILDEPFGALDPPAHEDLLTDLLPILRQRSMTTILISHDHLEAFALCDRVAILLSGQVAQVDTPRAILKHPRNEAVRQFVRAQPRYPAWSQAVAELTRESP